MHIQLIRGLRSDAHGGSLRLREFRERHGTRPWLVHTVPPPWLCELCVERGWPLGHLYFSAIVHLEMLLSFPRVRICGLVPMSATGVRRKQGPQQINQVPLCPVLACGQGSFSTAARRRVSSALDFRLPCRLACATWVARRPRCEEHSH